ncbi:MAG: right-handed parallel beta-helix repeat-containing protein [Geminicoccaceae bacterium]
MTRITARRLSVGTTACFGLLVLAAAPALAVECGEVITGQARLDRDLICEADPALIVNGGRLDLGGFTVVCDHEEGAPSVGVLLEGQGARLRGGAVAGCVLAIWVADLGGHIVRNVTASASNQGVFIDSDGNRLLDSAVLRGFNDAAVQINGDNNIARFNDIAGSSDQGFEVNGSDNRIVGNRIGGVGEGIQLAGDGNQVLRNHIIGTAERGVEVREGAHVIAFNLIADGGTDGIALIVGNGNHVHQNAVYGNGDEGIEVSTLDNTIERNRVLLNGVDLQDTTANCDNNLWENNEFETSDTPNSPENCIEGSVVPALVEG